MARRTRVLLLSPNRYRDPPVPPVGLECVARGLLEQGFEPHLLDLCFVSRPGEALEEALDAVRPALVGVGLRNLDTALFPAAESFLPEVRARVRQVRDRGIPVVLGGAGLRADPGGILRAVGADLCVVGPGERSLPEILCGRERLQGVIEGAPPPASSRLTGPVFADPAPYLAADGVLGFETHRGCSSGCPYCIEAGTPLWFRDPAAVLADLRCACDRGARRFHLLDPEFNEDEEHNLAVLRALLREGLDMEWALYMRPGRMRPGYFRMLRRSGAFLVTLSVDSLGRGADDWAVVRETVRRARGAGIRVAIDFLGWFPGESEAELRESLDRLEAAGADDVVVNTMIRLYPSLAVTRAEKVEAFIP